MALAKARNEAWEDVQPHLPPGETQVARRVLDWLAGEGPGDPTLAGEAVRRFQQLSAPIAAKGVEDTAFYRYAPLLSANDVGSAPEQFSIAPGLFHQRAAARARDFPHAMLATATHDHKRGEDVRARLAVSSAVPGLWQKHWRKWDTMSDPDATVHPADRYQLWQTLMGAWPGSNASMELFLDRMSGWLEKTLREGRVRSSWEAPDTAYEAAAQALLASVLANRELIGDVDSFVQHLRPAAMANSLVQTVLKFCTPGIPDIYQGCEALDFSLVDPDNRRPVDYDRRRQWLSHPDGDDGIKLALVRELLTMRRNAPALFAEGDYRSLIVTGARKDHVLAFRRQHEGRTLFCAVQIRCGATMVDAQGQPHSSWWADTQIEGCDDPAAILFADRPYSFKLSE